jgi:DNA-binding TFAR19-related protein (PDSD5 family)
MNEKNEEKEEHELEKIRLKKMKALMESQKMQQAAKERVNGIYEKIDFVLRAVMEPDAYNHLNKLRSTDPSVYQRIYGELVSQDVVQNIDYLIALIRQRGGVGRRIPLDVIIYLERKIKGVKSSIKVKQGDGEMMDLGSYLSK